jgi:hypothetical protein
MFTTFRYSQQGDDPIRVERRQYAHEIHRGRGPQHVACETCRLKKVSSPVVVVGLKKKKKKTRWPRRRERCWTLTMAWNLISELSSVTVQRQEAQLRPMPGKVH